MKPRREKAYSHFLAAERLSREGNLEQAELECREVLMLVFSHGGADELLFEMQMDRQGLPYSRLIVEAELAAGTRSVRSGEMEQARRSFRSALEYLKWIPAGAYGEYSRLRVESWLEYLRQKGEEEPYDLRAGSWNHYAGEVVIPEERNPDRY